MLYTVQLYTEVLYIIVCTLLVYSAQQQLLLGTYVM